MAVKLIDIKRTYSGGGMCLKLLADSKEDTLPTLIADVPGLTGAGSITPGSVCYTPALDMCVMGNNGQLGPWV